MLFDTPKPGAHTRSRLPLVTCSSRNGAADDAVAVKARASTRVVNRRSVFIRGTPCMMGAPSSLQYQELHRLGTASFQSREIDSGRDHAAGAIAAIPPRQPLARERQARHQAPVDR